MGVSEFQAIVMAGGKGSRMTELTARKQKCLLPIGNRPMVWYPIRFLEKSGFQEVTVVVAESARAEVQVALERAGGLEGVRCDVLGIPATADDWGTADTLRHLTDAAKLQPEADLVVVPCDLVTDFNLRGVLDLFRQHDASVASLFFRPSPARLPATTPGPKTKEKPERDLVAFEPESSRLVFVASASDYESEVCVARALLRRHGGKVRIQSRLIDAHVYVLRRWLCRFLQHNRNISTLKGELVPYVVKRQLSRPADKPNGRTQDLVDIAREMSASGVEGEIGGCDPVRCYALLAPDTAYATRANTLLEYCRANKEVLSMRWGEREGVADSVVAPGAIVAERTTVRASAIGPHASIGPRSRLSDTVLMAGARVGQNCVLSNCVVGEDAVIEDGCHLTDCLVGDRHTVTTAEKHSNEVLTDDDHLIEIV